MIELFLRLFCPNILGQNDCSSGCNHTKKQHEKENILGHKADARNRSTRIGTEHYSIGRTNQNAEKLFQNQRQTELMHWQGALRRLGNFHFISIFLAFFSWICLIKSAPADRNPLHAKVFHSFIGSNIFRIAVSNEFFDFKVFAAPFNQGLSHFCRITITLKGLLNNPAKFCILVVQNSKGNAPDMVFLKENGILKVCLIFAVPLLLAFIDEFPGVFKRITR